MAHEKPIKIFKRAWPLDIFANNRILKLNTRAKYETNSITKIKGANANGTPEGKKRLTKPQPLFHTHIKSM